MLPSFLQPDMIRTSRIEDNLLEILIHNALEPDFLTMARRKVWSISPIENQPPEPYAGYIVTGREACDEIEARSNTNNPWFAFDDSNKWEGEKRWK